MKNVIIIGANGFLGSNVAKRLVEQDVNIFAVVHENTDRLDGIDSPYFHIIHDFNELFDNSVDCYDALYYFAWSGNSGNARADISLQQDNIMAACLTMQRAKEINCKKFIFAGSIMEYEAFSSIRIQDLRPGMGNIYSASKLTADIYLKTLASKYEISYICLLISNIFGPGERNPRLINSTIRKILNGEETAFSTSTQLYDFIYLDDAIDKFIIIGDKAEYGSYYIGNPEQKPLRDFIVTLGEVCGRKESDMGIGVYGESTQIIDYGLINTSQFEEQFDYRNKVGFREGIARTKESIERELNIL